MSKLTIHKSDGARQTFTGRQAWMLRRLIDAGSRGITLLDHPAPRGSHYIYMLRKAGLNISTTNEPHEGPFPGMHGRYRLETSITLVLGRTASNDLSVPITTHAV
ncbi:winged helix domain-containing protein [Bradyrhizobium japonicum]